MDYLDKKRKYGRDYDDNYGKILGMNNAGYSAREIANAMDLPYYKVVETIQIAYARSIMYGTNDGYERRRRV